SKRRSKASGSSGDACSAPAEVDERTVMPGMLPGTGLGRLDLAQAPTAAGLEQSGPGPLLSHIKTAPP
ncbi:hypothetical protein, partial [Ideonella azotifigens]|uniref:hypothetical protein n=1 Tax=Ideonella azotifigens TaxID=513160 RepID=UPI001B8757F4